MTATDIIDLANSFMRKSDMLKKQLLSFLKISDDIPWHQLFNKIKQNIEFDSDFNAKLGAHLQLLNQVEMNIAFPQKDQLESSIRLIENMILYLVKYRK